MVKSKTQSSPLQKSILKLSRFHFAYVAALAAQIIIYDAWKLLAPEAVMQRWLATGAFLVSVTAVWYFAHAGRAENFYRRLSFLLITADIAIAAFSIYNQRGMASRAIILFVIPLFVAAALKSRSALFATAILGMTAYVTSAVSYFVLNFNEGYKIELYGELGLYCCVLLIMAGLLSSLYANRDS